MKETTKKWGQLDAGKYEIILEKGLIMFSVQRESRKFRCRETDSDIYTHKRK